MLTLAREAALLVLALPVTCHTPVSVMLSSNAIMPSSSRLHQSTGKSLVYRWFIFWLLCVCAVCPLRCAEVAQAQRAAGGFWVLRPDSGDPVEVVLMVRQ